MNKKAFTLVELVVVLFIISLTTALVMPNLWNTGKRALKSEAKRIGATLRYINDEAIGKKRLFTVTFDLDSGSWGFRSEGESRKFQLNKDIILNDVHVPSLGKVSNGEVIMKFGASGPAEPLTVHLVAGDNDYTVQFNHISGRSKVQRGYKL
jgi:type II secretion system protein H